MAFRLALLAAVLAVAQGQSPYPVYPSPYALHGYNSPAPAALTATSSNILRTPGNLGQISTYSKSIDTPYSSVRKSDVRVSNDALAYPAYHAPAAYAAPATYHAPTTTYAAAPAAYHTPIAYGPSAYAAPAGYATPAVAKYVAPATYAAHAYAPAPVAAVAHPAYAPAVHAYAPAVPAYAPAGPAYAPAVPAYAPAAHGPVGVAYSPAASVSHLSYSNSYGIQYGY